MNQNLLKMKRAYPARRQTTHKYNSVDIPQKSVSFRDEVSQGSLPLTEVHLVESYKVHNSPATNCLNCACNLF